MGRHAPPPRRRPAIIPVSAAAIAAAPRIRNTKAELLDTITSQHKTIIHQTEAMARISDAHDLKVLRLKMVIVIRRQLEKRLRQAIADLVTFYETPRHSGYVHSEMARIDEIRELAQ